MSTYSKLLPLLTIGFFGYYQSETIQDVVEGPVDIVKVVVTHFELASFRRMIVLQLTTNSLPGHFPQHFDQYLRQNFHSNFRDIAYDYWEEPYQAQKQDNEYVLWSNGPDLEIDTEDDIEIYVSTKP